MEESLGNLKQIIESGAYLDTVSKLADINLVNEIIDLNTRIEILEEYIQYLKDKAV